MSGPPPIWVPPATEPPATRSSRLVRPRTGRWIGGVCAGLARRFHTSPGVVRLIFVVSCLLPGPQFVLYLILWAVIPSE